MDAAPQSVSDHRQTVSITSAAELVRDTPPPDTIIAVSQDDEGLFALEQSPGEFDPAPITVAPGQAPTPPPHKARSVASAPVRFKIRLANTEGRRSSASYLIHKMYGWRGYAATGPSAAPNRVTLVASDAEKALATITVGFDAPGGLLVDDLYKAEIDTLRLSGGRICEFTKLAVDRNEQSKEVLAMMFHIAYMYARRLYQCTDLLIEVNPRHVRFYDRMLGFQVLGPERMCGRVGAPAVLLWLRLQHADLQIARYGGHKELAGAVRSLYPFFFSPEEEIGIVQRLKAIG